MLQKLLPRFVIKHLRSDLWSDTVSTYSAWSGCLNKNQRNTKKVRLFFRSFFFFFFFWWKNDFRKRRIQIYDILHNWHYLTYSLHVFLIIKKINIHKGKLLQLKLIHIFARAILLVKMLEIEKTKPTFIISVLKFEY
jgi:hypothetical protein